MGRRWASEAGIAADVYARLRDDILSGRRAPGERLKSSEMTVAFGASVGAVREALTRLETERLVQSQRNLGFRVVPLSHRDLADLTIARIQVETLVLRMSVESGDLRWEADVVAAHHRLHGTAFLADHGSPALSPDWTVVHEQFHRALLGGCRNRRLLDVAISLREEYDLYRQWSVAFGQEPERDLPREHHDLMAATISRDAELAAGLLRDHIAHTGQLVVSVAIDEPIADIGELMRAASPLPSND